MSFSLPFFATAPLTIGLERSHRHLRAASMTMRGGVPHVEQLFDIELDSDTDVSDLKKYLSSSICVTALEASATLVRPLKIQLTKERDIDAALPFQAEPLLPYPLEEAVIDKIVLGKSEDSTMLSLVAVRKEQVHSHLERWHELAIEPEVITAIPIALAAFSAFAAPGAPLHYSVHIGMNETTCALVRGSLLLATQTFAEGVAGFQAAYAADVATEKTAFTHPPFDQLDFSVIDAAHQPMLSAAVARWERQAFRTVLALGKQARGEAAEAVLFVGDGALLPQLTKKLLANINLPQIQLEAKEGLSTEQQNLFSLPIGMAASVMPKSPCRLDFRQNEFSYPNRWHRIKKPLTVYLGLALLLAAAVYLACTAYLGQRDNALRSQYMQLLAATRKSYDAVERQVAEKLSPGRPAPLPDSFSGTPLELLTPEQLSLRIAMINKELQSMPELFPLLPVVPRVSDLLAWLSTHPNVAIASEEQNQPANALQIENLSYTMTKKPEQNRKQDHYQVKVELEFTSTSPKQARAFHDALIAPNDFIDPKGEVKWSANQGRYRTSFFLRDKTIYPSK